MVAGRGTTFQDIFPEQTTGDGEEMIELFYQPKVGKPKAVSYVHRIKDDPLDMEELELFRSNTLREGCGVRANPATLFESLLENT